MELIRNIQTKIFGYIGTVPTPEKWIFLVSCYNSGSTLLHEILAMHPQIGSMPKEGQFYTDQFVLPKAVGLPRLWALEPELFYLNDMNGSEIDEIVLKKQWGARFNFSTRPYLMEKSPPNAARMLWLQKHFKNSYFIGIIRNGFAVAEGIRRKSGHSLQNASLQWLHSNEIMLRDFNRVNNKLLITYENMTENSEEILADIFSFLALDTVDIKNLINRTWKIQEKESAINNMNNDSIDRLTDEEREIIKDIAGELLIRFNYL